MINIQTRFTDYDSFGHVNNTVYLQYLDLGKINYFRAVLRHDMEVRGGAGMVIVHLDMQFYSPALVGEPLAVATACVAISVHSFTLSQRILNPLTGDVKCVTRTVMAAFDPATNRGGTLRPEWVRGLRQYEGEPAI